MNGRELRDCLRKGLRVYGTCVTATSPHWMGIAASAGLDFVFIDTEHIQIDRRTLSWMCQVFRAQKMAPIVRIPSPDPYQASMVLDGGASGVIGPYVETPQQVQELRGAVKFRPLKGRRLRDFLSGKQPLEQELSAYLTARNAHNLLVVNIESTPALEALDAILAVPDLDAVLIGPHDLSCSLGVPEQYGHPTFNEAVSTIIKKARACNVGVGIHYSEDVDRQIGWAREGANFVVHSSDLRAAKDALSSEFQAIRVALGDQPQPAGGAPSQIV